MRVKQPDVIGGPRAVRHAVVPGSGRGCGPGTAEALDKNDRDREQQAPGVPSRPRRVRPRRAYLADQLGLEPGPRLRELHQSLLRNEPIRDAGAPADDDRARSTAPTTPAQQPYRGRVRVGQVVEHHEQRPFPRRGGDQVASLDRELPAGHLGRSGTGGRLDRWPTVA